MNGNIQCWPLDPYSCYSAVPRTGEGLAWGHEHNLLTSSAKEGGLGVPLGCGCVMCCVPYHSLVGGNQVVAGYNDGFHPRWAITFCTVEEIPNDHGCWLACAHISPPQVLNNIFELRGTAPCPGNRTCAAWHPEVLLYEWKHIWLQGKCKMCKQMQTWMEKCFTIYLLCHKYVCPSLC